MICESVWAKDNCSCVCLNRPLYFRFMQYTSKITQSQNHQAIRVQFSKKIFLTHPKHDNK